METFLTKSLRFLNLISIDVVFGAMAGMLFFSDVLQVQVPCSSYLLLAIAVWCIYTLDHLMDARFVNGTPSSPRHHFHGRHQVKFIIAILLLIGFSTFWIRSEEELHFLLIPGIILAILMLIGMVLIKFEGKSFSWMKEITISICYVLGISLAPVITKGFESIGWIYFAFGIAFVFTALTNLWILSYLDSEIDQKDGFGSISQHFSKKELKQLIWVAGGTGLTLSIGLLIWLPSYYKVLSSILILMILLHLYLFQKDPEGNSGLRQKLEAVFSLPWILLFFQ